MSQPLTVVVGHCTDTTAKIFVCAKNAPDGAQLHARISFRSGNAGAIASFDQPLEARGRYAQTVLRLTTLPASSRIFYEIDIAERVEHLRSEEDMMAGSLRSFRLLPNDRPLRIAFVSCNGAWAVEDESRRFRMWDELAKAINPKSSPAGKAADDGIGVDMVVHGGDQIYADPIWMKYDSDYKNRGLTPKDSKRVDALTDEYRTWYVEKSWNAPNVAHVLASVPNLMTWDDHDIFDGYGSHDLDDKPAQQAFKIAASTAFKEFQCSHGPGPLGSSSALTAMTHNQVAVLMLDTRTNRMWKRRAVLGDDQFKDIDKWCKSSLGGIKRLYVVSSIPFVHANVAGALALLKLVPGTEPIEDDLRDAWTAGNNRDECQRIVKRLFSLQVEYPELQVTVLSGDVHVGAIAEMRSRLPAHQPSGRKQPRMFQVTSSGVGHPPPNGLAMLAIRRATAATLSLGNDDMVGSLTNLNGAQGHLVESRNFVVMSLCGEVPTEWDPHGNLTVDYYAEEQDGRVAKLPQVLFGPGVGDVA